MKDDKTTEHRNFPFPWDDKEFDELADAEEYVHPEHGRVVSRRFEPYHDVTVYEDGHEDWYYIGE